MKAEDLKSEADRDHAHREEKRHRARTYKDRAITPPPIVCVNCGHENDCHAAMHCYCKLGGNILICIRMTPRSPQNQGGIERSRGSARWEKPPLCVECGLYGGSCTCPKR